MPIATELFRIMTKADIEHVWDVLTPPEGRVPYLYGLVAESTWTPGSTVTLTGPGGRSLAGTVIVADRPTRLSYTLGDRTDTPAVYVSWQLRGAPNGTVVRLYVDEIDPASSDADELESAWLPVMTALKEHLEAAAGDRPTPAA